MTRHEFNERSAPQKVLDALAGLVRGPLCGGILGTRANSPALENRCAVEPPALAGRRIAGYGRRGQKRHEGNEAKPHDSIF